MPKKFIFSYLLPALLGIHLSAGMPNGAEVASSPAADIPIFHSGYNVKTSLDPLTEATTVKYHVQTVYPAAEVLEFYDAYFNGRGWNSSFETCQRNWTDFADASTTGDLTARLLFASWEHAGSNLIVLLWIKHQKHVDERQDEVVVEYRIQPITKR